MYYFEPRNNNKEKKLSVIITKVWHIKAIYGTYLQFLRKLFKFIERTNVVVTIHLGFQKRHKGNITASVHS